MVVDACSSLWRVFFSPELGATERQILKLIAEDRTSKEIAELLACSVRTVETHRQNISYKLELSGSHSLLRFAFDHKAEL